MIINRKLYQNILKIPKNIQYHNFNDYIHTIDLYHQGKLYKTFHLTDLDCNNLYYIFSIDIDELPNYEYEYIIDGYEKGILTILDPSENKDYNTDIDIKQYDPDE